MNTVIAIYVPREVKESYDKDNDKNRKALHKQLKGIIAAKYGLKINESRVTSKEE